MAHKSYYIKKKERITRDTKRFIEKIRKLEEYHPLVIRKLYDGNKLLTFDTINVGLLIYNGREPILLRKSLGDVEIFGRLEDIIKTKEDLEQKTEFKLEGIK